MKGDWVFCLSETSAKEIVDRCDQKTRGLIDEMVDVFLDLRKEAIESDSNE